MAVFAAVDVSLLLNSVQMGTMATSVGLNIDVDTPEATAFGATAQFRAFVAGLKKGTLALAFNDDEAAAQTSALLFPLLGTAVPFEVKATTAAPSATNPRYTGTVIVTQFAKGFKVGDLATMTLTFPTTGAVLRQIT